MRFSLFCLLALSLAAVAAADKPRQTAADPRYGVVLYEYFQSNYFSALSELMVAKERGGIQGHGDNPELIEGSLNLAYGMDKRATDIYDRLLDEDRPLSVRNAAWFYLSKIRYLRGDNVGARESLDKIVAPISRDLADELEAMQIQLLMRERKYDEAEERLAKASRNTSRQFQFWRPYLNFNLGAFYARNENNKTAQGFFSKVIEQRLSDNPIFYNEQFALFDKAFIANGFSYFQDENYQQAAQQFGKVRQATPLANDALLGFGWAKARQGDYQAALVPWSFLSQRPLADDAVQEALIAIPYAYLQLGDVDKALSSYARAETIYLDELNSIDEAGVSLLGASLVDIFDLDNFGTTYSWLVPENNTLVKPPSRYLLPLLSSNGFQTEVQTLVDLHRIRRSLEAWQLDLDAYADLMDYRLRAFRLQQTPEGYRDMTAELINLQQQRDQLAAEITQAEQQRNVFAFLDEDRKDLLEMIASAENNIQRLAAAGEFVEEEQEWVARYRGLLAWSANQDFDDRLWQMQGSLNAINDALESSARANNTIQSLLTEAPDITDAQSRIGDYQARVNSLLTTNSQVMASLEEEIRQKLFAGLALQRQRVQFYLGEARLAVAQLYDNEYLQRTQPE